MPPSTSLPGNQVPGPGHRPVACLPAGPSFASSPAPTLLIVDDDECIRRVLRDTLESLGYGVIEARDSTSAPEVYRRHRPALVILDLLMPDRDGLEVMRELRRINPRACILVVSGGGRIDAQSYLHTASLLGANATLAKPYQRSDLHAKIAGLLG